MKAISRYAGICLAVLLPFVCAAPGAAQEVQQADEQFNIRRFQVDGNTLLPLPTIEALVAPFRGPNRVYGDIQKALEALEGAYRIRGYTTVQVTVPEQELTSGVVRIEVTEATIGKVVVRGNNFYLYENIRAALPALREGTVPTLREISQNIQLSNESSSKKVEVTLGASDDDGKVDAKIVVTDEDPQRYFATVDDTGTAATGRLRTGIAYQNGNLFNRDHSVTLAYTTSPDSPGAVKVDIFSIGYRVPLYALGDSVDFLYGHSSVDTPSSSPTLGGSLGVVGKGDVAALRLNHYFARRGEYSSKLIFGLDYKYINSRCAVGGVAVSYQPPTPPIASCVPYTSRPVSVTYSGQSQGIESSLDYSVGLAYNLPLGSRYTNLNGAIDRFSYLTPGNRATRDDFAVLRVGGSYLKGFKNDWQLRLVGNAQYASNPLVSAEQFGMAGSNAVRGFNERAVAADKGYVVNIEAYAPDLAKWANVPGSLRLLAFFDTARGYNLNANGTTILAQSGIASLGLGVRYVAGKNLTFKADFVTVTNSGPPGTQQRGDRRAHASMLIGF